jgi:hypothetical protein|tara:strand:- start:10660 stop:11064 length:405 start_codon:yes stop_codon:yes gene_type:complete
MADTKVSDLTPITVANNSDVLYIVRASAGGTSNKITFQDLLSGVNDNITTLTTTVNTNQSTVLDLSGTFESANINIGPLTTTTRILCSIQLGLSAELDELSDDVEGTIGTGLSRTVAIGGTTLTFLSGVLTQVS